MRFPSLQSGLESGIIGIIVGLFLAFAVISFSGFNETQDASIVQSVQTDLQKTITEASHRQGIPPKTLLPANVINAVKMNIPFSARLHATGLDQSPYELVFSSSGRRVVFFITPEGDVRIKGMLGHWTRFRSVNGVISKN